MARRISFINYKGGVGKTSLIVNTAAALARMGNRVLLVDLDTQSNASIWLMRLEKWNKLNESGTGSIYSILTNNQPLAECIIRDVTESKEGDCLLPGLDLLPTTFNLVDLEAEYKSNPQRPHYVEFYEQLKQVEGNYDYILFDCPPNILRASQLGIFSSNEIYVPANPDALSLIGFTLLVEKLMIFNARSASFRQVGMGVPAQVERIVFNAVQPGLDIEVPKMRMQLRINQYKKAKRISPQASLSATTVRDATIVRRSVTLGLPVIFVSAASDAQGNVASDYIALAKEIHEAK